MSSANFSRRLVARVGSLLLPLAAVAVAACSSPSVGGTDAGHPTPTDAGPVDAGSVMSCMAAGCGTNATCTPTENGASACLCNSGYSGDGGSCTAIDSCILADGGAGGGCDPNATCAVTGPGTNSCTCNNGYAGDGGTCAAIDNCVLPDGGAGGGCDPNATCAVTGPGANSCTCNTGYSGSGLVCLPVDSCATANGGCDPNAFCMSTGPGTNTCACNAGYSGDGGTCAVIDNCTFPTPAPLDAGVTDGGGATLTDAGHGFGGCDPNATCTMTGPGTNSCACNGGFLGNGYQCAAIDNCILADGGTGGGCDQNATCTMTGPGTSACVCDPGFFGSGKSCAPTNSCLTANGGCNQNATCTSTGTGTNSCACNTGYSGNGTSCTPVDNCPFPDGGSAPGVDAGCDPNATCASTGPGTNVCTCNTGLAGPGNICVVAGGLAINGGAASTTAAAVTLDLLPPQNFLKNGNLATGDLTDWTSISNEGSGAQITAPALFSGDVYVGSYLWDTRGQVVDLLAAGLTAAQLDGANPPTLTVLEWVAGTEVPTDGAYYFLHAELRDTSTGAAVTSQNVGSESAPEMVTQAYTPYSVSFSGYPSGVRYLYIEDGSQDANFWGGNYGSRIANAFVGVTTTLKVAISNPAIGSTPLVFDWASTLPWTLPLMGNNTVQVDYQDASGHLLQSTTASIQFCAPGTAYSTEYAACLDSQECEDGTANCDPHATCVDSPGSFTCTCNAPYIGSGVACATPGAFTINGGASFTSSSTVTLDLQPTGNLLTNGDLASGTLAPSWTSVVNGGNGAAIDPKGLFSGDYYHTSYAWDAKSQTVNLLTAGLTATQLDTTQPRLLVLDWAIGTGPNVNDKYMLSGTLLNSSESNVATQNDGTEGSPTILSGQWTPHALEFNNYGTGVRYVTFEDGSQDVEFWAGQYGGEMANAYVGVPPAQVAVSNDGVSYLAEPYSPTVPWTLTGTGEVTVYIQYLDAYGNLYQALTASIGYCPTGQSLDNGICVDDQECEDGTAKCDPNATCTDSPGAYTCACKTGYYGSGATCMPIDECTMKGACDVNATCTQAGTSYTCACNSGYSGSGKICTQITACNPDPCDPNATCTLTGGSPGYLCTCNSGYSGNGATCTAVNGCLVSGACDPNATCTPGNAGSYTCGCNAGYSGDGTTCTPINDCMASPPPCDPHATCFFTGPAEYKCACNTGYSGSGTTCTPLDACTDGTAKCGANSTCQDTGPGTFTCNCDSGYAPVNGQCEPTGPCNPNPCASGYTCSNSVLTAYGWECSNPSSTSTNVCSGNPTLCDDHASCIPAGKGGYACLCQPGYNGSGQPGTCAPTNVCSDPGWCLNGTCTDTGPGTFKCACDPGYATANPRLCYLQNPCAETVSPCGADANCILRLAGTVTAAPVYLCTCQQGYVLSGGTCTAIDACTNGEARCSPNATCTDTGPGLYTCACNSGYSGNGETCTEIDPCVATPPPCGANGVCERTGPGTYECACRVGFSEQGGSCMPVDACNSNPCSSNATCTDTGPGVYTCACNSGYSGNGKTCTAIDACTTGTPPCNSHATCTDTGPGTYSCACDQGWTGDGKTCVPAMPPPAG